MKLSSIALVILPFYTATFTQARLRYSRRANVPQVNDVMDTQIADVHKVGEINEEPNETNPTVEANAALKDTWKFDQATTDVDTKDFVARPLNDVDENNNYFVPMNVTPNDSLKTWSDTEKNQNANSVQTFLNEEAMENEVHEINDEVNEINDEVNEINDEVSEINDEVSEINENNINFLQADDGNYYEVESVDSDDRMDSNTLLDAAIEDEYEDEDVYEDEDE